MELTEINALEKIQSEAKERADKANKLAITPENAKKNETVRTANNKFIKSAELAVEQIKEAYLAPLNEQLKPYLEAIEPLKEANKELSARLLEAKKKAFEESIREEMRLLDYEDENGETPSFEEIYNPSWFSLTKADAHEALLNALRKWKHKGKRLDVLITANLTESELERLTQYMRLSDLTYEFTIMEDK